MSRLKNATDNSSGEIDLTYNSIGRLTVESQKIGLMIREVSREYNAVGKVTRLYYPNGRLNEYTYDNNHLMNTVSSNGTIVADYDFNAVNAPITKTMGNGVVLNIQYNNRYQVTKHEWKKNALTLTGFNYGHDSVGNRTYSENLVTNTKSEVFAFDNADRLTSFKTGVLNATKDNIVTPTLLQSWVLDSIGNWAGFNDNGLNSTNTFNDTHEMTQFKGQAITSDNNGNLIFDGFRTFIYDAFNRLVKVKVGAVVLATYQYDALNRRVLKAIDSNIDGTVDYTIKYLYAGFRCLEELDGNDNLTKEFVFGGLYQDEIILQKSGVTEYYFTHDERYSVTRLTNDTGGIVESYDYKVYGERTASGTGLTEIGYTGQRHDKEATGLMYFKNRYYSPTMGQFITRDPMGYISGMSMYQGYFGAQGKDPFGYYDEEGHYFTTYLVGVGTGMEASAAAELAFYSQLPDEMSVFDAIPNSIDDYKHLGLSEEAHEWHMLVNNYMHSLIGSENDMETRRICIEKMFKDPKFTKEKWQQGLLIHAYGDTWGHLDEAGKPFETALGHAKKLHGPDHLELQPERYLDYVNRLAKLIGSKPLDTKIRDGLKEAALTKPEHWWELESTTHEKVISQFESLANKNNIHWVKNAGKYNPYSEEDPANTGRYIPNKEEVKSYLLRMKESCDACDKNKEELKKEAFSNAMSKGGSFEVRK